VDPEVEALYGLPLDEFIKARDALAKARAKEQGKEAGAAVKALRKPSATAWALNQLARRQPTEVQSLLAAGDRLRRAQTAALEGGDPDELREATRAEAGEVQALAGQAGAILADAGRGGSAAHEDRLATTLRAAAVDPEAGDLLRRGVLTTELSPAGFGFGVGDDSPLPDLRASSADGPRSTHESRKAEPDREREAARKQEERAERQRRRELEGELRAARETAARLEREAEKAEELAEKARQAADAATARVQKLSQE
jgi:hypothetical protein